MLEIRQREEGGYRLAGVLMTYGDQASVYGQLERFEPGSIRFADSVLLNAQHDRNRPLARWPDGGLRLTDSPSEARLEADLPPTTLAKDVHALIKGGVLRGLSVEFRAEAERLEAGVRIIERAHLAAVAVVDRPAYALATIEARAAPPPPRRWFFL